MNRVTWVSAAVKAPMGQQQYEHEIQTALRDLAEPGWEFTSIRVSSARSGMRETKRFPTRVNTQAPLMVSRLIGSLLYGNPPLVHRFDLRLPSAWGREVVTIHDLPPLRFDDEGDLTRAALDGARRALRVIVPSQFAAAEMAELLNIDNVDVIPYGIGGEYVDSVPAADEQLERLEIREPFLLHAAGATTRKNLAGLAAAWRIVSTGNDQLSLVLCGPPDPRRDAAFAGVENVVMTGRIRPSQIAGLMRRAAAVVVPSVYEGFGLPALEGMACGAPVVAARRGALPEVCGDAAILVEPDGDGLAEGIEQVLRDVALADGLRQRGPQRAATFSWTEAAREHLRVYGSALS